MPYIKPEYRVFYDDEIDRLSLALQQDCYPGDLNYVITRLCVGFLAGKSSYADYNDVIGVLECAKQELIRKVLNPHEDKACAKNGEVYDVQ